MNKIIHKIIIEVFASIILLSSAVATTVSTPYANTFDTETSTNDFIFVKSPVSEYTTFLLSTTSMRYTMSLYGSTAKANLTAWALLEFSDLGSNAVIKSNFNMETEMGARNYGVDTYSGTQVGFAILGTDTNLTSYYRATVKMGSSSTIMQISKFENGAETSYVTNQIDVIYTKDRKYGMEIQGTYAQSILSLKYVFWDKVDSVTNTLDFIDSEPLNGTFFGHWDYSFKGNSLTSWYNLDITSSEIKTPGTIVIIE